MFEKVQAFIAQKTGQPADAIQLDTALTALGVDSMQLMMMVLDFETEFNITILDRMLSQLQTVSDLVELVNN